MASCGSHREATQNATLSLLPNRNQIWQLTFINGRDVGSKSTTLSFNPEAGTFRGQTTCNTYAGNYTLGEASPVDGRRPLTISLLDLGTIRCPEVDMNAESRFLAVLQKANYIIISQYYLKLYQNKKEILHFELQ